MPLPRSDKCFESSGTRNKTGARDVFECVVDPGFGYYDGQVGLPAGGCLQGDAFDLHNSFRCCKCCVVMWQAGCAT